MPQMNVQMALTLADTASGPLRAFTGLLEQLEVVTNRLGAKLAGIAEGLTGIGAAAGRSASEIAASGTATAAFEAAVGTLNGSLTGLTTRLGEVSGQFAALGAEAVAAGAAVNAGSANMGAGLGQANAQAGSLMTTLKGLGELYAAMKIEKFLGNSVKEAGEYSVEVAKVEALNVGATKTEEVLGKAWDDSKALKFASALDTVQARLAAIGGLAQTTDQKVIDATLPAAMTLANNLRMMGEKGSSEDMVRNAYGMTEARGQTTDPEAMKRTFDLIQRSFSATGGKINMRDWESMLRQLGQGSNQISDEGLLNLIGVMDQLKISGGGNSGGGAQRVGTAFKMLEAYGLGKPMNKQGAELFRDAGIISPGALVPSGKSSLKQNIKPGGFRDAALLATDPVGWVQKMVPLIMDYMKANAGRFYQGADPNDPEAQAVALQKFITSTGISVTAAQALGLAAQPKTAERIKAQADIAKNALGVDDTKEKLDKTLPQQLANAKAAFENLYIVIGEKLLPILTPLIEKFAEFIRSAAEFSAEHPMLTFFTVAATVIGGFLLAVAGVEAVFGPLSALTVALRAVAPAAEAGMGGAAAATAAGGAGMLAGFLKIAAGVFKLILAFDVGYLIGGYLHDWLLKCEVGGVDILTWAVGWGDRFVTLIENVWTRAKQFFGFMTQGAADADVAANKAGLRQRLAANADSAHMGQTGGATGSWAGAPSTGGATGTWGSPPAPVAATKPAVARTPRAGGGRAHKGRADTYNPDADLAANQFKTEQDDLRANLKQLDEIYKKGTLSVEDYYTDKQAALEAGIEGEMKALDAERKAFRLAGNSAGVNRVDTQMEAAKNRLETGTEQNEAAKKQELNKLDQTAIALQREMLATSGERHRAELLHLQQQEEAKTKLLVTNGKITQDEADAYMAQTKAKGELALRNHELAQIQETYAERTAEIDERERSGAISQAAAAEEKYEARKAFVAVLDAEIERQKALAVLSKDDGAVLALEKLKRRNPVGMSPEEVEQAQVLKGAQSGFDNFFKSILSGTKSIKDSFRNLGTSILDTINGIVAKKLGDALFDSLFGSMVKGGSSGSSSFGGFGSFLGSLFGGSSGASTGAELSSAAGMAIGTFATGIDNVPQDMLAVIHKGERVMTAADNAVYTPMQQGRTQINHINVSPPAGMSNKSANQLGADIARQIAAADRRNN